jgi:hypothetical protein
MIAIVACKNLHDRRSGNWRAAGYATSGAVTLVAISL